MFKNKWNYLLLMTECYIYHSFFFFLMIFIYFLSERAKAWAGEGQRERGTEDPKWAPCWQQQAQYGGWTHKPSCHDLSPSPTLNPLSHPGSPIIHFTKNDLLGAPGWLSRLSIQLLISVHVMISWLVRSSPMLGSALRAQSLLGILSLRPSSTAPLFPAPQKINK